MTRILISSHMPTQKAESEPNGFYIEISTKWASFFCIACICNWHCVCLRTVKSFRISPWTRSSLGRISHGTANCVSGNMYSTWTNKLEIEEKKINFNFGNSTLKLLSMYSPYFVSLFDGNFDEATKKEIELKGKTEINNPAAFHVKNYYF